MISHTMADLEALADEHDRKKARGFVERAGLVMLGGLPEAEMGLINQAVRLSAAEENMLVNWSTPPSWDPRPAASPNRRAAGSSWSRSAAWPGIPVRIALTDVERAVNDTNKRWHQSDPVADPQGLLGADPL